MHFILFIKVHGYKSNILEYILNSNSNTNTTYILSFCINFLRKLHKTDKPQEDRDFYKRKQIFSRYSVKSVHVRL